MHPALKALLALTAAAYLGSLLGPFQFDDYAVVATDRAAQDWAAWWETLAQRIRPLLKASFVATHQLGDWLGHPTLGHHLGNLLVHLAAVALAWRLALAMAESLRMPADAARRAALGCAAFFALHPLATESVAYISGRSVALGTLFALAALVAQLQAGREGRTGARRFAWHGAAIAAFAAFAAALLARETMIVLPLLAVLLEWGRGAAPGDPFTVARLRLALRRTAGLWLLAVAAAAVLVLHRRYAPLLELSALIAQDRLGSPSLLFALEHFATRLALLASPNIDPAFQPEHIGTAHRALATLAIALALALAWRGRHARPWWILGGAWVVATLVPLYLVPIRHDGVAERHFYPALWGAGFALACEIAVRLRPVPAAATAGALAIVLATATAMRNADYASEVALWEATSRQPGAGPRAFNNLGVAYLGERRWDEASRSFERALALDPGYGLARANLDRADAGRRTGDPLAEPEI